MTTGEFATPSDDGIIRGIHTDIALNNVDELQSYLTESYGPETLYRMQPEGLYYPIHYASLEFHKNDTDDLSLFANSTFDALVVNGQEIKNWQKLLSQRLTQAFIAEGIEIYRLPHQRHDFYAKIDDMHAIHVRFDAETHECSVILSTEYLSSLSYASEGKHRFEPDPDDTEPVPHIDLLRRFSTVWVSVLDAITDEFGETTLEERERPRINVGLPPAESAEEPDSTSKELDILRPLDPPEVEMFASNTDGLDMIGGLTHAKRRLREIADMFKDPVGSYMYGLSATHFLLHGPPGTGKTSLVQAFANELGAKVWPIDSTSLVDKWVGNTGKNTKDVFEALKQQPGDELIVVFMQEFEAIAISGNGGTQERLDMKKQLNLAIDDITKNHKNIIIAADTNADIADLEPSLVRAGRIEPIGAPAPDETERVDVWAAVLTKSIRSFGGMNDIEEASQDAEKIPVFIPYEEDIDPNELARLTDGRTGADFEEMLTKARIKQFQLFRRTGEYGRVSQADLIEQIRMFGR
jgi:hypothetical protein